MRRAAKVDTNHREIVAALERCGCSVQSLAAVGAGVPDLLVGVAARAGRLTLLMEVKDGARPPSERRLTPDQALEAILAATGFQIVMTTSGEIRVVSRIRAPAAAKMEPHAAVVSPGGSF